MKEKVYLNLAMTVIKTQFKVSCVMRESALYICKNKCPDQLNCNRTAEQRLSLCYIDNTSTLHRKGSVMVSYCKSLWFLEEIKVSQLFFNVQFTLSGFSMLW